MYREEGQKLLSGVGRDQNPFIFLNMRNALQPPVYSQLYNLGDNEVQMPNLDISMALDREVNVHGYSFYLHSDNNQLTGGSLLAAPYQTLINYEPVAGYQSTSSCHDSISLQSSIESKRALVPEVDRLATQMRKRPIGITSLLPRTDYSNLVENKTDKKEWHSKKRKKGNPCEEHWHHPLQGRIKTQEIPKLQLPVRRSQKLIDKITALQKLVSPYGKTDTASVLQEASLYIKLLQQQIQNLFQMLSSSSYDATRAIQHPQEQESNSKLEGLRSRGLCLVPISLTQKITQEHLTSSIIQGTLS